MQSLTFVDFLQNFKKVGEGIYKNNQAISDIDCDYIYSFMYNNNNNPIINQDAVPWDPANGNVLYYRNISDRKLLDIINEHKAELAAAIGAIYNEKIYPHLTTIVLWKPGQSMGRHVDNGAKTEQENGLKMRKYTSVAYINDDFEGGETFIRSDGKTEPDFRLSYDYMFPNHDFEDYISKPEKGSVIFFGGDDMNAHGVTKLLTGTRVILSVWFTTDSTLQEPVL